MSHSVKVTLIADQCISINGKEINIHDLNTIEVDENGVIVNYWPTQHRAHWTLRLWAWLKNIVGLGLRQ